jgi:hypothetical protein
MTLKEAFEDLLNNWQDLPKEYKEQYKAYRTKFLKPDPEKHYYVGEDKKREMLTKAGYKGIEKWVKPKKKKINTKK